jgi:3-dehydroquinate synthase
MVECIEVAVGNKPYSIYIGENLLYQVQLITPYITGKQVMIISNSAIANHYLAPLQELLSAYQCDVTILPEGEAHKNLSTLNTIFTQLIEHQHHRDTTLLALGGGVIGDLTGFAAACYMRGINYIQLPTTLLAQVDAAIGGKTAINHVRAKNLIGAFYQPRCVIIDTVTLNTLPEREFKAGLAEVVKYGLMADPIFFNWLETNISKILARDSATLTYMIKTCCQIKATIVAQDETDQGVRLLLNLGHTFAHAIESGLGYGYYLHGEAVAIGLCLAAEVSQQLADFPVKDTLRIKQLLTKFSLPIELPRSLSIKQLLSLMTNDKKAKHAHLTLILLRNIGSAYCQDNVDHQWLLNYL